MNAGLKPHDPFAVNTGAAMEALNATWGRIYEIGYDGLRWYARRKGGTGDVLSGLSPDDIAVAMRAGWAGGR